MLIERAEIPYVVSMDFWQYKVKVIRTHFNVAGVLSAYQHPDMLDGGEHLKCLKKGYSPLTQQKYLFILNFDCIELYFNKLG